MKDKFERFLDIYSSTTQGTASAPRANVIVPHVLESTPQGERLYDIYTRLLKDRIVFLGSQVDDFVSNLIVAQFLFLESEAPEKEIHMYINSPGGSVSAGMAMYDIMQYISCPVHTYCTGMAASMGAVLLTGGEKGHRYALPNSSIMIHQPLGGAQGQASDIELAANRIMKIKKKLNQLISDHCGQPVDKVEKDTDRDNFMSAEEAKAYGLIDHVVAKKEKKLTKEKS